VSVVDRVLTACLRRIARRSDDDAEACVCTDARIRDRGSVPSQQGDCPLACRACRALLGWVLQVESDMELPYASLHQRCEPMLHRLLGLPDPQRQAPETLFGMSAGAAPDCFLVGLAELSLFSEVADGRPLLCVIDDAPVAPSARLSVARARPSASTPCGIKLHPARIDDDSSVRGKTRPIDGDERCVRW
jgi:hypothetical protein